MRIPGFVKFLGLLLVIGLLAGLVYFIFDSFTAVAIFLIGACIVLLLLGLLSLMARAKRRRAAQQFGSSLAMQGGAAPNAMSQAEEMARLDDIKKKFEEGLSKYKSAGKDIYSLPWYMIVGEPGSGKTEAVRRSGITFPPGMQDEFQGAGGTINMNWWFANQAVMLDLAGRLVFEDVVPGKSSEWTEFLKLLAQSRSTCPVNGMLLVIPADSLIQDSPQEIQQKANKLAQQCEIVQRALDIRFPVYVIVSKSDLIIGFREIFDGLNNPAEQGQILGWSNPNPLDDIFNPKDLDRHLDVVRDRLNYRRLALLEDPRPQQDLSKRRMDEVDALFDFPNSFDKVIPPLQQYLENIFVKSEWSAKPLFLRGIYFTSSMREGAAIDDALASVLGVEAGALPEGRAWERDKAFFLKDLFVEKIFRERGLVTRATNVQHQSRRQKFTLLAGAAIGLAALIAITFFSGRSLDKAIKDEHTIWSGIIKSWPEDAQEPKSFFQVVTPEQKEGQTVWKYQGSQPLPRSFGSKRPTMGETHKLLLALSEEAPKVPLIFRAFRPIGEGLESKRRQAARSAYEMSVLFPLIQSTRQKLAETEEWDDTSTAAFKQVLKIELDEQGIEYDPNDARGQNLLDAMLGYLIEDKEQFDDYDAEDAEHFKASLDWSYTSDGGKGSWPPDWAAEGNSALADNPQLEEASNKFIAWCGKPPAARKLEEQVAKLSELEKSIADFDKTSVAAYGESEELMVKFLQSNLRHMQNLEVFHDLRETWPERFGRLKGAYETLKVDYAALSEMVDAIPLVKEENLDDAFSNSIATAIQESIGLFEALNISFDRKKVEKLRQQRAEDEEDAEEEKTAADRLKALITNDGDMVDELKLKMLAEIEKMEKRYSSKSILASLKGFQDQFRELTIAIDKKQEDFALYEPLLLPQELHTETDLWKSSRNSLIKSNISDLHRTLEAFCLAVDKRGRAWAESWSDEVASAASLKLLSSQATTGIEHLAELNASLRVKNVLQSWERKFIGEPIEDRSQVLGLSLDEFTDQMLVRKAEGDVGFYYQYWDNAMSRALESLKIQAINERQKQRPAIAKYKAFPLAPWVAGAPELTVEQLYEAQEILNRFRPYEDIEEPLNLATGEKTDMPGMNAILDELRSLGLNKYDWDREVYTVLDLLPRNKDSREQAAIFIPSLSQQKDLIRSRGLSSVDVDSFLGVWKYFMLGPEGGADQVRTKWNLYVYDESPKTDKNPATIPFPIRDYEFRFYANPSDDTPDRIIAMKGPWGPLRMLHEHPSVRDPEDPTKWRIEFVKPDKLTRKRHLWLEFHFAGRVYPTLETWPGARR